jgi:hypothetical protein
MEIDVTCARVGVLVCGYVDRGADRGTGGATRRCSHRRVMVSLREDKGIKGQRIGQQPTCALFLYFDNNDKN